MLRQVIFASSNLSKQARARILHALQHKRAAHHANRTRTLTLSLAALMNAARRVRSGGSPDTSGSW